MRRRFLAAVVFFVLLAALAAPLWGFMSGFTDDGGDFVAEELPFLVRSDSDERRAGEGAYVPGELLVKFVRGASESEIAGFGV